MSQFPEIQSLFDANRKWAEGINEKEPGFFASTTKGQAPKILWIGCADSRVPESVIMGRKPGDVFVMRNVANQFQPKDDSANALLDYAVGTVGVDHVLVVGHTGCGGCIAAWGAPPPTHAPHAQDHPLSRFLDPVVRLKHIMPPGTGVDDLIKENVKANVRNVIASDVMQDAWRSAQRGEMKPIYVHGWIYDLGTGHLNDLEISAGPEISPLPRSDDEVLGQQASEQERELRGETLIRA